MDDPVGWVCQTLQVVDESPPSGHGLEAEVVGSFLHQAETRLPEDGVTAALQRGRRIAGDGQRGDGMSGIGGLA